MSFEPESAAAAAPPPPANLSPANGTAFPDGTTKVTLSWGAVADAGTYSVRVDDLTNPDMRHAGNNCPKNDRYVCRDGITLTSLAVNVIKGHTYAWSVRKGAGAAASARFRVGESDAAEFMAQAVPEIVAPGATGVATVTVRNAGSTTWTPEGGYKLGSQNPQDNMTWGRNRVQMPAGARVLPGKVYTFSVPFTAPATPQVGHFQWRMVRERVQWFGQRTVDRYVHVKARPDGGSRLKRDTATGLLRDSAGSVTTLRGGLYHTFEKHGRCVRRHVYKSDDPAHVPPHYRKGETIFKEYVNVPPCPAPRLPQSELVEWQSGAAGGWADFFDSLRANDINLVRVFLTNGFGIVNEQELEVYPYKTATQGDKLMWRVKLATTQPLNPASWNEAFFTRLKAFARIAAQRMVFLQLSLFNYYDLDQDTWDASMWNPARSPDRAWGDANLVNPDAQFKCSDGGGFAAEEGRRNCYFMEPQKPGLLNVQEQLVRKVTRELAGQPNVILEVMNEPHRGSQGSSARFASRVVGWILDEGGKQTTPWRPLISVNAARHGVGSEDPDDFDVDWWAAHQLEVPHYEDVDIISFHGLTGYPNYPPQGAVNPCNPQANRVWFPRIDLEAIRARFDSFRRKQTGKALMLSTDAVRVAPYVHNYGAHPMDLMEGQITTNLNRAGTSLDDRVKRSDLEDWAYWCFLVGRQRGSVIHFQQHSNSEAIYVRINAGFRAAFAAAAAAVASLEAEDQE